MSVDPEQARKRVMDEKARVEGLIHNLKDGLGDEAENDELSELSDYDQHPADTASETMGSASRTPARAVSHSPANTAAPLAMSVT